MSKDNSLEPTADDIYLAKLTMDEVGADIETEGHVAVTDENRTLDPFTDKGALANALDEALDYSNPNIDPTELPKDVSTEEAIVPKNGDTTLDEAPKEGEAKDAKDALAEALEGAVAMDEGERGEDVVSEPDEEMHHRWEMDEIKKNVPEVPESLDPEPKDGGRIVYLTYTFTVDPSKYRSANYQPIANAGGINAFSKGTPTNPQQRLMPDETVEVAEEVEVDSESEPTPKEEKAAAQEANKEEKQEKEAEDEAPSKEVLDYATFIDGSSFICCDEVAGIDYSKITMDAGAKKATERPSCKTTFAQCRAKNPLFCRYHGPKLLEKDIKTAIAANLGKGCTVSVTKDKGQKNPLTFRLTIGCPASMKKNVEFTVHQFMTNNPGISSPEEYKDLGNGKQTMEFDMDILQADKPPSKKDLKGQASVYETEKAKAKGKVMPVVGETPAKIEKLASQGGVQPQEEDIQEETDLEQQALKAEEWEQMTGPMLQEQYEEAISDMPIGVYENAWSELLLKELADAFEKAFEAKDHEAAKKAIEGLNMLKAKFAQEDKADAPEDAKKDNIFDKPFGVQNMLKLLGGVNKAIPDFNVSYDATDAIKTDNPSDIKISANGDGDFGKMLDKINYIFNGSGYEVKGTDGSNMSIVKKGENTQGNEDSGSDDGEYEDDAAKEMWHEIDGIANDNKDIMGGEIYNNYSAATKALDLMDSWHHSLESLKGKLKELPENPTAVVDVLSAASLENAIKAAQGSYDAMKTKAEWAIKEFKDSVDKANESATEGIKGIFGGSVYNSVKNVAAAVFPNGKPDGVDSAEEMIDYIADDFIDAGKALMKKYPDFSLDVCKKQFGITKKYNAATNAAKEFNDAVKEFKTKIDAAKDKKAAMALKDYSDKVADAASKFQKAHNGFKNAITLAKLSMDDFEGIKEAEKRENKGNGEMAAPTAEQIHDAAIKLAKYMYNGSPEYMKYFENTIDTLVNYELAFSNIDKQKFGEESAIQKAIHYYYPMLEKLDVAPELMTTLKKLVDMPKKGKKGKKGKESNASDLGSANLKPTDGVQYSYSNHGKIPYGDNAKFMDAMHKAGIGKSDELGEITLKYEVKDDGTAVIHLGTHYGDHTKTDKLMGLLNDAGFQGVKMDYDKKPGAPEMSILTIPPQGGTSKASSKESTANEDLSGLLKEPHTLSTKIPPLIQEALDKYNPTSTHGGFGKFNSFVVGDYGDTPGSVIIKMENKGKDEDGNQAKVSLDQLANLKDDMNSVFNKHGLNVDFYGKPQDLANLGKANFVVTAANKPADKQKKKGTIDFKKFMAEKAKEKESMNNDFSSVMDKIDKAKSNGNQKVANADTASMKAFFEGLVEKGDIEGAKNYLNAWKEFSDELGDSSGSSSKEGDIKKEFNEVIEALNKKGIAKDFHTKLFTGYLDKGDIESAKIVVETMKDVLKAMGGSISKPSNGGSDDAISKKVASMPLEKKLAIAVEVLKDKLAHDPTNMELSKKLSLYQKKLDEIKKKKHEDDYLE